MASLVAGRHETVLWARSPEVARTIDQHHRNEAYLPGFDLSPHLRATSDLEEALRSTEVLLVAVPSHGFRDVLLAAQPLVPEGIPVVSLTKGIEQGSLLRMTEVIEDVLPGRSPAVLTGPNLAREVLARQASASVVASRDEAIAVSLQEVLSRGTFRVYRSADLIGCEVSGALKNVFAIAAGMAEGLGTGDNTRAGVIARSLAELTRLGVAMGGEPETFAGLAGLGDLIATCMSPQSRNRYVGEQLGQGRPIDDIVSEMSMVAEGVRTAGTAVALGERYSVDVPISLRVYQVISGEISGAEAYRGLTPVASTEADPY